MLSWKGFDSPLRKITKNTCSVWLRDECLRPSFIFPPPPRSWNQTALPRYRSYCIDGTCRYPSLVLLPMHRTIDGNCIRAKRQRKTEAHFLDILPNIKSKSLKSVTFHGTLHLRKVGYHQLQLNYFLRGRLRGGPACLVLGQLKHK